MVQRIAVAVSGGRDSTALWHATARAAQGSALQVVGLHVHHGLQPQFLTGLPVLSMPRMRSCVLGWAMSWQNAWRSSFIR